MTLLWVETEFEYPDRHEDYKQSESTEGGWVIQEFPAELGGAVRLVNEIGVDVGNVAAARALAERLQAAILGAETREGPDE